MTDAITLGDMIAMGSVLIGAVGLTFKFNASVENVNKTQDQKRDRVYARLDEHKRFIDDQFTRKDVCKILHEQVKNDLAEIKADVKKILTHTNGKEK